MIEELPVYFWHGSSVDFFYSSGYQISTLRRLYYKTERALFISKIIACKIVDTLTRPWLHVEQKCCRNV